MSPPRIAYQTTRLHLQTMQTAKQLEVLADAWAYFLIFHQRTWNKSEAHYRGSKFWGSLLPKYAARRRHDPILVYVHQARHVDEHGIQSIAKLQRGSTIVSSGTLTGGTRITGGGSYVLDTGSTATITVHPSSVLSEPVINKGINYYPPVLDGRPNPPVIRIAEEAIKFFDDLFSDIDAAGGD